MRLWSIHPKYLDPKGLVALWREALLAQKVLLGQTKGYKNHPQLIRFKKNINPLGAIAHYLKIVFKEAEQRGYNFNKNKIISKNFKGKILVTSDQLEYEFNHLLKKLKNRDPLLYNSLKNTQEIKPHPLLKKIKGKIESWEVIS